MRAEKNPTKDRDTDAGARPPMRVVVCVNKMPGPGGKCCGQAGGPAIAEALRTGVGARGIRAEITEIVCLGKCADGPNLRIVGGEFHQHLRPDDVPRLLDLLEDRAGKCKPTTALYPGA